MTAGSKLTLGPLLFNWPAGRIRDFYARIADEAPVDTVHLGEAVCSKREPFLREVLPEAAERLARSGKEVVWSTLGLIADGRDVRATRTLVDDLRELGGLVEANDLTALSMLDGRPCVIGPTVNIYNEGTLVWLAERGAIRACLPPEVPEPAITALAGAAGPVELELFAFGRMPLALSARCYHARAHGLHKDGCRYVCGEDPDGMPLETLDGEPFLAVNGIQTLSHAVTDLSLDAGRLAEAGIRRFRLSPQAVDMVAVAETWRALLDGRTEAAEARARIAGLVDFAELANGYLHGLAGAVRTA